MLEIPNQKIVHCDKAARQYFHAANEFAKKRQMEISKC